MKIPKPIKEYECTSCFNSHKTRAIAIKCCSDVKASISFKCGSCDTSFGDQYEEALLCCQYKESELDIYLDQCSEPHTIYECIKCNKLYQEWERAKYCCSEEKLK